MRKIERLEKENQELKDQVELVHDVMNMVTTEYISYKANLEAAAKTLNSIKEKFVSKIGLYEYGNN